MKSFGIEYATVRMVVYLIVYFAVCTVMLMPCSGHGKIMWYVFIIPLCLFGVYESIVALLQLFGWIDSGNHLFVLTGTFKNPGPFGAFLAMCVAVAGSAAYRLFNQEKKSFWFLFLASAFCAMLLPASMSRGAIVALFIAGCVFLLKEFKAASWLKQHKMSAAYIAVAILAICVGLFYLKKDSAIGRLHIWNIECRAILKHPFGTGPGSFEETYGAVQEEYFRAKKRPAAIVRVAGCPDHSFNEFLGIGVEFGIPGMLLAVSFVVICIYVLLAKRSPLAYGLIVLAAFAFFSYPLDVPLLAGSLSIILGAGTAEALKMTTKKWPLAISFVALASSVYVLAVIQLPKEIERENAEASWRKAKYWSDTKRYDLAVEEFALAKNTMSNNKNFLYDYGYALYLAQRYEESLIVLESGAHISNDPMFHNIIGRNCEALGNVICAEEEYWKAHYMVPCRLYPLQRLMLLYLRQGRYEEAASIREKALAMPVNPLNRAMVNIYYEIDKTKI